MRLAVAVLMMLALASVIGTFIKQNEPWGDYELKFGPFWFRLYETLGIFDLYASPWFVVLLMFLVFSVISCVWRHAPSFARELIGGVRTMSVDSLKLMRWRYEHYVAAGAAPADFIELLRGERFDVRSKAQGEGLMIRAVRGRFNRLGYFCAHLGVVVICLGALYDTSLALKWASWRGDAVPETRDIPVTDIPDSAWIGSDNRAFRGQIDIPEGVSANVVFLPHKDGYFVQKLPFWVKVDDFQIEHYPTGQPRAYKSYLSIYSPTNVLRSTAVIGVNHPITIDGITIYQASFSDGGSQLALRIHDWGAPRSSTATVAVHQSLPLADHELAIEMEDFRLFNIANDGDTHAMRNYGPSFTYRLRSRDGTARQYENYMIPIDRDGRSFFVSGVRSELSDDFEYLYIPADNKGSMKRFVRFVNALYDDQRIAALVIDDHQDANIRSQRQLMVHLIRAFRTNGFESISSYLEQLPEERREVVGASALDLLKAALSLVYIDVLERHEAIAPPSLGEQDSRFFDDAVFAISALKKYGSPVLLQLEHFKHVQSSGLQMTKAPGQPVVYIGCLMLVVGIFIMFYLPRARVWLYWSERYSIFALEGARCPLERDRLFHRLRRCYNAPGGGGTGA